MTTLDCRLSSIEGFEAHKALCEAILERLPPSPHGRGVLLTLGEPSRSYCQYTFMYDPQDGYALKMLQDMTYLRRAWGHLARSHGLREVFVVDAGVDVVGDPSTDDLGSLRFVAIRAADFGLESPVPLPPAAQPGLFGWLKQLVSQPEDDWLTRLERLIKRFEDSDEVDDDLLPDTRTALRVRLLEENQRAAAAKNWPLMKRLTKAYLGLPKFKPACARASYFEARVKMHASAGESDAMQRHYRALQDVCLASEDIGLMYQRTLPLLAILTVHDASVMRTLVEAEEHSVAWCIRTIDPGYLTRASLALAGLLRDLEPLGPGFIQDFWRYQRGLWLLYQADWDNAAEDLTAVADTTSDTDLQLQAHLALAEVRLGQGRMREVVSVCQKVESKVVDRDARQCVWLLTAQQLKLRARGDSDVIYREVRNNAVCWSRAFLYGENKSEHLAMVYSLDASAVSNRLAGVLRALADEEAAAGNPTGHRELMELAVELLRRSVGFVYEGEVFITSYAAYALFMHSAWELARVIATEYPSQAEALCAEVVPRMSELIAAEGFDELRTFAEGFPSLPDAAMLVLVADVFNSAKEAQRRLQERND